MGTTGIERRTAADEKKLINWRDLVVFDMDAASESQHYDFDECTYGTLGSYVDDEGGCRVDSPAWNMLWFILPGVRWEEDEDGHLVGYPEPEQEDVDWSGFAEALELREQRQACRASE